MINKRGLSAIVATVLIILLVIVAISLLWSPIKKMIASSSERVEAGCLFSDVEILSSGTCYDSAANELHVTILNGPDQGVDKFKIFYGTEDDLTNFKTTVDGLAENGQKQFAVTYDGTIALTHIKIAPIVGKDECEASELFEISAC